MGFHNMECALHQNMVQGQKYEKLHNALHLFGYIHVHFAFFED